MAGEGPSGLKNFCRKEKKKPIRQVSEKDFWALKVKGNQFQKRINMTN